MTPTEEAVALVRSHPLMVPVRIELGETTEAAETCRPRHASDVEAHLIPMLWRARSENA